MLSKFKQWTVMFIIAAVIVGAGSVRITKFSAEIPAQSQNTIELTWIVENEVNVQGYRIERKMLSDSDFVPIHTVNAKGSGTYLWRDTGVFKATSSGEPVVYELYTLMGDGTQLGPEQVSVNFTSTAIRRTWGSIKAMFQ
jgi:hypothetical protein